MHGSESGKRFIGNGRRRRWPVVAMTVGLVFTGGSGGALLLNENSGNRALDRTPELSATQLTVGEMDSLGRMHSRKIIWQGHQAKGLGSGYEHHATLTIAKQKGSIEPNHFVLSFASAADMDDLYDSRNMSNATATLRPVKNPENETRVRLEETLHRDKDTGGIKRDYEALVLINPNKFYDIYITYTDNNSGQKVRLSYLEAIALV